MPFMPLNWQITYRPEPRGLKFVMVVVYTFRERLFGSPGRDVFTMESSRAPHGTDRSVVVHPHPHPRRGWI